MAKKAKQRKLSLEDLTEEIKGDTPNEFTPDSEGAKTIKISDEVKEAWADAHAQSTYHFNNANTAYRKYDQEHRSRKHRGRIAGLIDSANHLADFVDHPEYKKMKADDPLAEERLIKYVSEGIAKQLQEQGKQVTEAVMRDLEQEAIRRIQDYKNSDLPNHETLDYLREGLKARHLEVASRLPRSYLSKFQDDEEKLDELGGLIAARMKRANRAQTITQFDFQKIAHNAIDYAVQEARSFATQYAADSIYKEHKKPELVEKKAA